MVRNSTKYVSYKDLKEVSSDLKKIYASYSEAEGVRKLQNFSKKWDNKYPVIADIWQCNWTGVAPLFSFPDGIRRAIYTTNAIESANRQIRKIIFLALTNASKKWTMLIKDWSLVLNQFATLCDTELQNW